MTEQSMRPRYSRFNALLRIAGHIPYAVGSRLLAAAGAVAPLRSLMLRGRLRVLRSLLPVIAPDLDAGYQERVSFAANILVPWRANALSRCSDAEFDRWVGISGLEHLAEARSAGRGVTLIASHFSLNRLVPLAMLKKGYIVNAMEPEPWLLRMGVKGAEAIPVIDLRAGDKFWLKELFRAKKVLDTGGILHLAVDGLQGRQGRKACFLGKEREFFISFAELAAKTCAVVIPVFATVTPAGEVTITLERPLDSADESASHAEQVQLLLDQYVSRLESRWQANLGNVVPKHLQHYARLLTTDQCAADGRVAQPAAVDI